jgi:EAL domain-containing protein (putative c-di-GMP-specific phosphodiesterase class I)
MAAILSSPEPSVRLSELTVALQPVLDLRTGDVHGFEALLRGPDGCDVNPPALFRRARREGWDEALEYRARELAVAAAKRHLREGEVLFLNGDARFPVNAECYPHLVLEISEARNVDRRLITKLQRDGLALYLDDYGVSHGNLSRLLDMRPAGIKVDRAIIQGIASDPRRYVVAHALAGLADDLGIAIVAEGIETAEDLAAIRRVGFGFGQGYFLGRPELVPDRRRLRQVRSALCETAVIPNRRRRTVIAALP